MIKDREKQLIDSVLVGDELNSFDLLSAGIDPNIKGDQGYSVLQLAIWLGFSKIVEKLLDCGASVSCLANNGNTPLHTATWCSYRDINVITKSIYKITFALLQKGADPNVKNYFGLTPLHHAVYYGFTEITKLLIEYGADVKIKIDHVSKNSDLGKVCIPAHWEQFEISGFRAGMDALDIAAMKHHVALIEALKVN